MDFIREIFGDDPRLYKDHKRLGETQSLLHRYSGVIELLVMLPFYSIFTRGTLAYLKGFPKSRKAKITGNPPHIIIIHIFLSMAIISRYYTRRLFEEPVANQLDLTLGIAQLATAWYLTKWTPAKQNLYKSSFQVMTFMITFPVTMAYITASPQWYRTAVKCFDWFLYFRLIFTAAKKYHIFEPQRIPLDTSVHLVSVPVVLVLADWPKAIPVYLALLPCIMLLNEWVTRQAPNNQSKRTTLVALLVTASFCEYQTNRPPSAETNESAKADL